VVLGIKLEPELCHQSSNSGPIDEESRFQARAVCPNCFEAYRIIAPESGTCALIRLSKNSLLHPLICHLTGSENTPREFQDYLCGKGPSWAIMLDVCETQTEMSAAGPNGFAALIGAYRIAGITLASSGELEHLKKEIAPLDSGWHREVVPEANRVFQKLSGPSRRKIVPS
jgi:hypothetical protein